MDIYSTLLGASFVTLIVLFGNAIGTLVMAYLIISLLTIAQLATIIIFLNNLVQIFV